ncbi:MAG TPA: hypothetical protein PLH23_04970 [Hyphomonadaceae bacterium]|nr:hypothetical protein [Hyphomonadaceae bacterium]HPI47598.1 hypothetical protein [Hyphomonadaceae bacterium]
MADGTLPPASPRLIPLNDARAYLGGKHPALLGCTPVGRLWDRREIDHKLDLRAGIESLTGRTAPGTPANDSSEEGELGALAQRIADASRRV